VTARQARIAELYEAAGSAGTRVKDKSYCVKYLRFAMDEHCAASPLFPIFPLSLARLQLYADWLTENKVNSGLAGITKYVTAIVQWGKRHGGHADPRSEQQDGAESPEAARLWTEFTGKLTKDLVVTKDEKLRLQPAHLQAMVSQMSMEDPLDRRDATQYTFNLFSAVRPGHTAPAVRSEFKHGLRWQHVAFIPSVRHARRVMVRIESTKTRKKVEKKAWWTSVAALERSDGEQRFCPVSLLRMLFLADYNGDPTSPIFRSRTDPSLPVGRTEYTATLRARLLRSLPLLSIDPEFFSLKKYSGISWRKGGLSLLSSTGMEPNRLADHGDHASVETTRIYARDTIEERAVNTSRMAARFAGGAEYRHRGRADRVVGGDGQVTAAEAWARVAEATARRARGGGAGWERGEQSAAVRRPEGRREEDRASRAVA
jgi:hypothetical protein